MNVVECLDVSKSYRTVRAVDNLTFSLAANTITGLIGRNGAGKTTLLKLIAGYLRPTAGKVTVFGQEPFDNIQVAANLIFVDDRMTFPASFTLHEILQTVGEFYPNWDNELALKLMDYFALNPRYSHSWLSKGTQSTFNAIVGLAARCPLTIFDEPTSGMDAAVRKDFYRALLKEYMGHPRTVILSSHLLNEIENILEDVLLIQNGTKRLHLPIDELNDYALGLRGSAAQVGRLLDGLSGPDVLHRENFAPDTIFAVVKNDFTDSQLQELRKAGIEIAAVSAEDVCVFLTAAAKGGIDDVFARS